MTDTPKSAPHRTVSRRYEREVPVFALATALAPAALAVFRTSGTGVVAMLAQGLKARGFAEAPGKSVHYGHLRDASGALVDECVATVYRAPASYTGEESVELSVHGGLAVIAKTRDTLRALGFQDALPGEFTFRAFMNGKLDLVKAEAIEEIARAETDPARRGAAGRLSGGLSGEIENLKQRLVRVLAAAEIALDYAEDDDIHEDGVDEPAIEAAIAELKRLSASWSTSLIYRDGVSVAIAGRTNAGKSSLFNRLLREDRAIVSDIHGTTRDWLESRLDVRGLPVRLVDTAGLRHSDDEIERIGIERSRVVVAEADITLYVVDSGKGLTVEDERALGEIGEGKVVLVWSKVDLEGSLPPERGAIPFSSRTGEGFSLLEEAILDAAFEEAGGIPGDSIETSIASARQKELVDHAASALTEALESWRSGVSLDAVALDLREAVCALGEITGEVATDDVLDAMFSAFCVGK